MGSTQIVLNIGSLAPRAAFDLEWAANVAVECGFSGLSVLPFVSCQKPRPLSLPVVFVEEAWNPGNIIDFWRGVRGDATAPKLHDILLFPNSKQRCVQIFTTWLKKDSRTRPVVHDWDRFFELRSQGYNPLLEVSPGLWQSAEDIMAVLKRSNITDTKVLALDTHHLRRPPRPDEQAKYLAATGGYLPAPEEFALGKWEKTLVELLPHTGLIDFHPNNPEELTRTLANRNTELREMVLAVRRSGYKGPWRAEIHLGLLGQLKSRKLTETLSLVRERVEELL